MRKWTAIWIDQRSAKIFVPNGRNCTVLEIDSEVERSKKSTGGKKATRPYLHDSIGGIKSEFARRENDFKKYFTSVSEGIAQCDELLVIGHGTLKDEFATFLKSNVHWVGGIAVEVQTVGHMTSPELKQWVQAYFGVVKRRWEPFNPGKPIPQRTKKIESRAL